ncbi:hypothetical protein ACLBXB_20900 [Methylobacterium mesophilicum]
MNRAFLSQLPLLYPQSCLRSNQHGAFARIFKQNSGVLSEDCDRIKRELQLEIAGFDGAVLISAEEFSWLDRAEIFRLREFFVDYEVVVLIVFREQVEYINALYAEHVRWSAAPTSFCTFSVFNCFKMNYQDVLNNWSDAFSGSVDVTIYNKSTLTHDLFSKIGVRSDAPGLALHNDTHHPTLPPELVEVQAILANGRPGRLFQDQLWTCFGNAQKLGLEFRKFWQMPNLLNDEFIVYEQGNAEMARRLSMPDYLFGHSVYERFKKTHVEGHKPNPAAAVALFSFLNSQ